MGCIEGPFFAQVSVVIPARNEARRIGRLVEAIQDQCPKGTELEIIVVDDGSSDGTAEQAAAAGAVVLRRDAAMGGNPAAARNEGVAASRGDPIVFLDADCMPREDWLRTLLAAFGRKVDSVGGSLGMPPGLSFTARSDYYNCWYHTHPGRPAGPVEQHPPANLGVRRAAFLNCGGFSEQHPVADGHEELAWQARLLAKGGSIWFEPAAVVDHYNRPGLATIVVHSYRWGFSAIEAKNQAANVRFAAMYRHPWLVVALPAILIPAAALYVVACWVRSGILEPIMMAPLILIGRASHATGMIVGGLRWLARSPSRAPAYRRSWN